MNIVVVGLGSMGKRRIRLIRELYPEMTIYGVDGREDRRQESKELYGIDCFSGIADVIVDIQCAFVCTSPLSHSSIIEECLKRKWNVFTELNLVPDGYEKNIELAKENDCVLFLSSTFLYREETKFLRSEVAKEEGWNYVYHIGQYLPDWHPWENYKDFFVGNQRTNGCREILAIELPWLVDAFGAVKATNVVSDKMTQLGISYHDNYMIQLQHENGNKGVLIVDVVSPCAVRKLEIYREGSYYSWDGTPETLKKYDAEKGGLLEVQLSEMTEHVNGYRAFVVENAYKNEIREFFDVVNGVREPIYGFEKDLQILKVIDSLGA